MFWRLILLVLLTAGLASAQNDSARQMLRHAVELQQSGHYAEAIDAYRAFLKVDPEAAPVRSNLGAALAHEGRYTEAIREYSVALKSDPSNSGIRFNMGLAWYKMGDIAHAVREFEAVYAVQSDKDLNRQQLALLLSECYLRQGQNERVVAILDPLAALQPDNRALDYLLGTALLHMGQTERGASLIEKLLAGGDTAEAHMLMAYTQFQAHNMAKAVAEVDRAIALNPNLPEAYSLRGRLAFLQSDLKGAESYFQKSLALDPNGFDALLWMGTLLREEGRLDEAGKDLTHAMQLQPGEIRVRYQSARLSMENGNDKRAAEVLEALVEDHPEYTEAHRTLATIYFRLGRPADGRREKEIAEKMDAEIRKRNEAIGRSLTK